MDADRNSSVYKPKLVRRARRPRGHAEGRGVSFCNVSKTLVLLQSPADVARFARTVEATRNAKLEGDNATVANTS